MGTSKKEAARRERQGKVGDGMGNVKVKGENFYRSAKKVRTLNMFKDGKAQRNASGEITKAASYQSRDKPLARVEPNRKWFGNTRVISQDALAAFRGAVAEQSADPYSYLLKQNKLPMSLIRDNSDTKNGLKQHAAKIAIETAPFRDTFGPKAQRKRVKLAVASIEDLVKETVKMHDCYKERLEQINLLNGQAKESQETEGAQEREGTSSLAREAIFSKGQSKRIWNELYKVIDSSDVILHVLDARDPLGTRCHSVEKYLREEAPHKHVVFVLNKVDLIPSRVAAAWVRQLSAEKPTLAFHASTTNSFGKGSLISLLRQFSTLHSSRKQISVGFVGYPNVGKSSIINTLRKKKVCTVAPIAGETKVWQYITLMKRIYLIDCPGIVPPSRSDTDEQLLLRGSVRVENVEHPAQYVDAILRRCREKHLLRTYELRGHAGATDFLEQLARKGGRLLRGGEPDLDGVAKMVINDFLRGKVPWFSPPPGWEERAAGEKASGEEGAVGVGVEGREGKLGEMRRKRKRGGDDDGQDGVADGARDGGEGLDESFIGFSNEGSDGEDDSEDGAEESFAGFADDIEEGDDVDDDDEEDDDAGDGGVKLEDENFVAPDLDPESSSESGGSDDGSVSR